MTRRRRRPSPSPNDEPAPERNPEDWAASGDESAFAAEFTAGGAPVGPTTGEFRAMDEEFEPRAGWARAKAVLRRVLAEHGAGDARDAIGWIRHIGSGLTFDAFAAACVIRDGDRLDERPLVVRLPRADASADQPVLALREVAVLERLERARFPLRFPRVVGTAPSGRGVAIVQEALSGVPLDLRVGRMPGVRPCEIVAEAAVACHAVDPAVFADARIPRATRRDHAASHARAIDALAELDVPEADEARAWFDERVPPPGAAGRLLHGDLLGQNLLVPRDGGPLGVLDFAFAELGDPAYDLAIVTRGVKEPFQAKRGLANLLDAYNARGAATGLDPLTAADVHLHELHLTARWYADAVSEHGAAPDAPGAGVVTTARKKFVAVLRRAIAS